MATELPRALGSEGLAALRQIVNRNQAARVHHALVDMTTASTVVQVYDALNETNRARLLAMPLREATSVCLRLATAIRK